MTNQTQADAPEEKRKRRPRGQLVSQNLRLDAPKRDGYVRRFVHNNPARIMELENLGYQVVNDKAGEGSSRTHGVGSRIERMGGKDADGKPQHMILMETPLEEYQYGQEDKDAPARAFEEALKAGADTQGRLTDAYKPSDGSSIKTN